jgi:hypothetical protein
MVCKHKEFKKQWYDKHFAAPTLTDRLMTNHWDGVCGNGNMAANLKEKRTSFTTVPSLFRSFVTLPTHLLFHYPLLLSKNFNSFQNKSGSKWPRSCPYTAYHIHLLTGHKYNEMPCTCNECGTGCLSRRKDMS